jgi:hypothetical protein
MAQTTAPELAARLDRLPMSRHVWTLVTLISMGGRFELYDLFFTAYTINRSCSRHGLDRGRLGLSIRGVGCRRRCQDSR